MPENIVNITTAEKKQHLTQHNEGLYFIKYKYFNSKTT
jgi:hypothetical protein